MKNVVCYFDACCEPKNPGGAIGIGVIIRIDNENKLLHSDYRVAQESNTNNIGEYMALEKCIDFLLEEKLDADDVTIFGDSQLAIRQMNGEYGMNNGGYIPYAQRCLVKLASFRRKPKLSWIGREQNAEADVLSKKHLIENNIPIAKRGADSDVLYFGKYKGTPISAITDSGYLQWLLREGKIKPNMKTAIEKRLEQIEYLAK